MVKQYAAETTGPQYFSQTGDLTDSSDQRTVRDEQVSFLTLQACWTKAVSLEFSFLATHPDACICPCHDRHSRQKQALRPKRRKITVGIKRHRSRDLLKIKNLWRLMKSDRNTRSSKVFAAECAIANPFLLCRVTAFYARRLQKPRVQFAQSINESLRLIAELPQIQTETTNLPLPQLKDEAPELVNELAAVTL